MECQDAGICGDGAGGRKKVRGGKRDLNGVRKRDMKLSDCNVSRAKYNELKYFCMQYDEKKRELNQGYGLRAIVSDGMPRSSLPGNPTESAAVRNSMLKKDVDLIEQTAEEADADIYPWLIRNVTQGIPYEWLDVPLSRSRFYDGRRYFFYLLAQKR